MPDPTFKDDEGFYWKLTAISSNGIDDDIVNSMFCFSKDVDTPKKLLAHFIYVTRIMF